MKKLLLVLLSVMFLGSCVTSFKQSQIFDVTTARGNHFFCKVMFDVNEKDLLTNNTCKGTIIKGDVLYECEINLSSVDKVLDIENDCRIVIKK